jgi:hypothetical protein
MVEKGTLSWKGFYKNERSLRAGEISRRIDEWLGREDAEVLKVVNRGGVLSFPHTALDGSLDPVIRIVKAIKDSDMDRIIAMAVVHYGNTGPSDEFSLDLLEYIVEETRSRSDSDIPEITYLYPPEDKSPYKDIDDRINRAKAEANKLKDLDDGSTAFVITGDLSHYGEVYNRTTENPDFRKQMDEWIEECMDLIYHKGDYVEYLNKARISGNDQSILAIIIKELLGENLEYMFFQKSFTDYSEILAEPPPVFVASYFYGLWKKSF